MSSVPLRQGMVGTWPLGETPYGPEFNSNLEIINERSIFQIDYRRVPPSYPYSLPEDAPFTKINVVNGNVEFWAWVFDFDLGFDVLELQRSIVPYPGMVVGVKADQSYAIYTSGGWRHLWEERAPGAVEISIDCDFPRPNKIVGAVHAIQGMMIRAGAKGSRCIPSRIPNTDLSAQFQFRKNDVTFGTVTIPGQFGSITSPTFAVGQTTFEIGDRLSIKAPESLRGITGFNVTLRFEGIV